MIEKSWNFHTVISKLQRLVASGNLVNAEIFWSGSTQHFLIHSWFVSNNCWKDFSQAKCHHHHIDQQQIVSEFLPPKSLATAIDAWPTPKQPDHWTNLPFDHRPQISNNRSLWQLNKTKWTILFHWGLNISNCQVRKCLTYFMA